MDSHLSFLRTACRLCGKVLSRKADFADKSLFKNELLKHFEINIEEDLEQIHPSGICSGCKRSLYRIRANKDESTSKQAYLWTSHCEENCPCMKKARGRPLKSIEEKVMTKDNESDTESGEEIETEEEKKSCREFSALIQNIPLLDRELALVCAKELADQFNLIFLDRENIEFSIQCLNSQDKINLTSTIFQLEKENIKRDISSCSQTYKSLPVLLKVTPQTWVHARNSILASAVNALANEKTQPFQKAVSVDQLYSLVQPSFISPLMFASNLLAYSVTRSKLVLNIYGKFHPAGGITTARTWLNNLTMDVPQVPAGDILVAIDNDQVLIKKWTVRKDNRAQISVLTSVCVAPVHPDGTLQWDQSLSPG